MGLGSRVYGGIQGKLADIKGYTGINGDTWHLGFRAVINTVVSGGTTAHATLSIFSRA